MRILLICLLGFGALVAGFVLACVLLGALASALFPFKWMLRAKPTKKKRSSMARRQIEWANNARVNFVEALGAACAACGETKDLELDIIHKTPRDPDSHHHRKWNVSQRVAFWRREMEHNNLQLLCSTCNGRKGEPEPNPNETPQLPV